MHDMAVAPQNGALAQVAVTGHLWTRMCPRIAQTIVCPMFPNQLRSCAVVAVLLGLASCRNPAADANMTEQMRQVGDELNAARQEAAAMHEQIDSLRLTVARQDTLLRQLAGMANVPVPSR